MKQDKTALSFWFPILKAAGIPVPKTRIIPIQHDVQRSILATLYGKEEEFPDSLFSEIDAAAREFGYPCFLRTDHTSGKHSWKDTCFLRSVDDIGHHVFSIVEYSECSSVMGLPWDTWVVREFLPTMPVGTCPHYGDMPVCREFRFFVKDGRVVCSHPYWPRDALEEGGWTGTDDDYLRLCGEPSGLVDLAEAAGKAVGGAWSIDVLETTRGWFVTDMAEAYKSFHWRGCDSTENRERTASRTLLETAKMIRTKSTT